MTLTPPHPVSTSIQNIKTPDGGVYWLQWTIRAIFDDASKLKEYQLVGRDITELKLVEAALREGEEKNSALLSAIPDPILHIDRNGTCVDLRSKQGQSIKLLPDYVGKNIAEFFPPDVADLMMQHLTKIFLEGTSQVFQFALPQGTNISFQEARFVPFGKQEALAILRDVTERTYLEQQLHYLSMHDGLTGLYNRLHFAAEMRRLAGGSDNSFGIVVCDVDGLKTVNDNLGHSKGDELLKAAADVIVQAFKDSGDIARIGGDEFAVILPDVTLAAAEETCNRLREIVVQYNEHKQELFLSISVGVAVSGAEDTDPGKVFQRADAAMYSDKMSRRAVVHQRLRMMDGGKPGGCPG